MSDSSKEKDIKKKNEGGNNSKESTAKESTASVGANHPGNTGSNPGSRANSLKPSSQDIKDAVSGLGISVDNILASYKHDSYIIIITTCGKKLVWPETDPEDGNTYHNIELAKMRAVLNKQDERDAKMQSMVDAAVAKILGKKKG